MNRLGYSLLSGFIILIILLYRGLSLEPSYQASNLLNRAQPAYSSPDLTDLKKLRTALDSPGPHLVNIWASWCVNCEHEHAFLLELADAGIAIVGVNYKDSLSLARQHLNSKGNPYHLVLFDQSGRQFLKWGVIGTPETFMVDGDGIIRYRHTGPLTKSVWDQKLSKFFTARTAPL